MQQYRAWAQTGLYVCLAFAIPWAALLAVAGPVLAWLGVEPLLAESAGQYCFGLILGVPPYIGFFWLTKLLQAQSIVAPAVWIALAANLLNGLFNYVLIFKLGLGLNGAPLATSLSRWVQLLLGVGYLLAHRHGKLRASLPSLTRLDCGTVPSRVGTFLRLGVPGAIMLGLEAWFFELSTFLASFLGTVSFDAHCTLLNICAFTFLSFPFALGIAASIRVGQTLGAGAPQQAQATAQASFALVLVEMAVLASTKIGLRGQIGRVFTSDPAVVAKVAALVPIAALFQVAEGVQAVIGGVLRGMGRQSLVAWVNRARAELEP